MTVETRHGASGHVASSWRVSEMSESDDVIAASDVVPTGQRRACQDRNLGDGFCPTRHASRNVITAAKFSARSSADRLSGGVIRPSNARSAALPSPVNVRDSATEGFNHGTVLMKVNL